MHSLPIFVRLQGRRVLLIGDGAAAEAKRRLLERAGAVVVRDPPAALALVAEQGERADRIATELKQAGMLVNVVDRPDLCDFTMPAIVDRNPVLIAIGTGGASAGLAKVLRQWLETALPERLGTLAQGLADARAAICQRWPGSDARRHAIDAALQPGGALDPLASSHDMAAWLASDLVIAGTRTEQVRLSSPDPDELTLRAARLLGQADRVYYGPGVPQAILNRARADADRIAGAAPTTPGEGLTLDIRLASGDEAP